jgi:hypothetical protein
MGGRVTQGEGTMPKPVIDAKAALDALRSGISDSELMERYNLSARGLESLLKKLVKAGAITLDELETRMPEFVRQVSLASDAKPAPAQGVHTISAKDAVTDLKLGLSDTALMMKYRLSARGLEHLFEQLLSAELVDRNDIERRLMSSDSTVDVRDLQKELNMEPQQAPPTKASQAQAPERSADRTDATVELKVPPYSDATSDSTTVEMPRRRDRSDDVDATVELKAMPPETAAWKCPACDRPQPHPYDECPVCGVIVAKYLKKQNKA